VTSDKSKAFEMLANRLADLKDYNIKTTEEIFRNLVAELGIQSGDLVHPVRVALTGRAIGPGLFDTMIILGQQKTVNRLRQAFHKA
jgi:glutamyl/glutaminyl-tRNA synthetase